MASHALYGAFLAGFRVEDTAERLARARPDDWAVPILLCLLGLSHPWWCRGDRGLHIRMDRRPIISTPVDHVALTALHSTSLIDLAISVAIDNGAEVSMR